MKLTPVPVCVVFGFFHVLLHATVVRVTRLPEKVLKLNTFEEKSILHLVVRLTDSKLFI
jgi:hypothetical protein